MTNKFLPDNFSVSKWKDVKPFFDELEKREITSIASLEKWLQDRSELYEALEEELAWRYINTNRHTDNEHYKKSYIEYITQILPEEEKAANRLDKKLVNNPFFKELPDYPYGNLKKQTELKLKVYTDKNTELLAEARQLEQSYAEIVGKLTVNYDGKELTLQQAATYLENENRQIRKEVYELIYKKRKEVESELDTLFDKLVKLRHQIALNAGYKNYRDYKFDDLGRTDYTPGDCYRFHDTVKKYVVPIVNEIYRKKKDALGVAELMPYDLEAQIPGSITPKPQNILDNTIQAFTQLRPEFGEFLLDMKTRGYLDLESRKNKAPGGFNYPLYKTGVPFIFANFAGTFHDLQTMVHEGGHAIHSFLTANLPIVEFKEFPSEVAELASMSMELLSMKYWHLFFGSEEETKEAQKKQLEGVLKVLPWIATVDKFQHTIYTSPDLTPAERKETWKKVYEEFEPQTLSWNGFEHYKTILWQKQLHIFEVPFYYIEYGFAQLGSVGVWKNFVADNEAGIEQYRKALSLGYTVPISKIYETAGTKFSFSDDFVNGLMNFVKQQLNNL